MGFPSYKILSKLNGYGHFQIHGVKLLQDLPREKDSLD